MNTLPADVLIKYLEVIEMPCADFNEYRILLMKRIDYPLNETEQRRFNELQSKINLC